MTIEETIKAAVREAVLPRACPLCGGAKAFLAWYSRQGEPEDDDNGGYPGWPEFIGGES